MAHRANRMTRGGAVKLSTGAFAPGARNQSSELSRRACLCSKYTDGYSRTELVLSEQHRNLYKILWTYTRQCET